MKSHTLAITIALGAIIAPAKPMIYIALLAIFLDTAFGIWKSVKLKGWKSIKSRRLSVSISKSLLYSGAILFAFFIEKYIAADLLQLIVGVDLLLTKVVTLFCIITEIKSINESYEDVTGVNIWTKFKNMVIRAKDEVDEIKD